MLFLTTGIVMGDNMNNTMPDKKFYRLTHLFPADVEDNGRVSVCVRCRDEAEHPRVLVFTFSDWYKAIAFREQVIVQDGIYR